jgi:uncharacterized membrane protein
MTRYELLVFLHVSGAIIWLGAGFLVTILELKAGRTGDPAEMRRVGETNKWLAPRLFIPSALATFVLGVLLTIEGPWSFGDLWIVLGLAGFATTFITGIGFLSPESKRLDAAIAAHGPTSAQAQRHMHRLVLATRVDMVVLFAVVFVMTSKPAPEDRWLLAGLAAAIVAVAATIVGLSRPRAAPEAPAVPAARSHAST